MIYTFYDIRHFFIISIPSSISSYIIFNGGSSLSFVLAVNIKSPFSIHNLAISVAFLFYESEIPIIKPKPDISLISFISDNFS